jgi:hypothetical protein
MEITPKVEITANAVTAHGKVIPIESISHLRFFNCTMDGAHLLHLSALDRDYRKLFAVRPPVLAFWKVAKVSGRIMAAYEYLAKATARQRVAAHAQNLASKGFTTFENCELHRDGTVREKSSGNQANFIVAKEKGIFEQGVKSDTKSFKSVSGGTYWISETGAASRNVGWTSIFNDPANRIAILTPEIDGDILPAVFAHVEAGVRAA